MDDKARAVVLDEWALLRFGVSELLRSEGIPVVGEARDADEGIRVARTSGASLVVVGNLPSQPLADTIRALKELPQEPGVVGLVTAAERANLTQLLKLGPDALLERSTGAAELSDAVNRVRAGERVVAPSLHGAVISALRRTGAKGCPNLTPKEQEVLALLAEGRSNREIAAALFVTPATVKTHVSHIYGKLDVGSRFQAMARGAELGLLR